MKTSSNTHTKIKNDLSDAFTKEMDNYLETLQHMLLLLDKYTEKPMAIVQSKGTAFVQKGGKTKESDKKEGGQTMLQRQNVFPVQEIWTSKLSL